MGAGERSEAYRKRPAACARIPRAYTQPSSAPAHKPGNPASSRQIQSEPGRHREGRRSCPLQRKGTSFSPAWMERVWTVDIHCVPEQLAKTHLSRSSMLIARRRAAGSPRPRRAQISAAIYQAAAGSSGRLLQTHGPAQATRRRCSDRHPGPSARAAARARPTASGVWRCVASAAAIALRILTA
jgi:hypothetical protein